MPALCFRKNLKTKAFAFCKNAGDQPKAASGSSKTRILENRCEAKDLKTAKSGSNGASWHTISGRWDASRRKTRRDRNGTGRNRLRNRSPRFPQRQDSVRDRRKPRQSPHDPRQPSRNRGYNLFFSDQKFPEKRKTENRLFRDRLYLSFWNHSKQVLTVFIFRNPFREVG